ncbi:unnamed protein product [Musa acuminata var. zebrina]
MATSDATGSPAVFASLSEPTAFTAASDLTIDWPASSGGRVARPSSRRRPRASRRAPVTMLNTDTANFRAMVQQFTGVPSGPYSSGYRRGGGPVVTFGRSSSDPVRETVTVFPEQHYRPSSSSGDISIRRQRLALAATTAIHFFKSSPPIPR